MPRASVDESVNHILAGVSDLGLAVGIEKMLPDLENLDAGSRPA